MGEGKEKRLPRNSLLKMSSSLSKRWVCCKNFSRVFFLIAYFTILWVMRVYIVWVKGIRVT